MIIPSHLGILSISSGAVVLPLLPNPKLWCCIEWEAMPMLERRQEKCRRGKWLSLREVLRLSEEAERMVKAIVPNILLKPSWLSQNPVITTYQFVLLNTRVSEFVNEVMKQQQSKKRKA